MRWRPFPIVGGSYADDTKPWSVQDTVNYLPVSAERSGTRSTSMLKSAPGFTAFCDLGTGLPIRGAHNAEGLLLVVSGNTLFSVSPKGMATSLGTIPGVGRVSMAHNQITGGNQIAIANGLGGYVYDTTKGTLTQITDEGFVGAIDFDYVDSYIVGVEPGKRFWFTSDLADATSYNTLDRYEAEGSPDKIMGLIVTHREVWVMGERTIEPFQNTGATEGTFQRAAGMVMERGLASTFAMALLDNSVFWLGDDGCVYRANGYQPVRVSTFPIEQAIARCNMSLAFAFTFEDQGHKVFYLTFPDGHTWGYDVASGEWHRRQSYGYQRWRLNTLTKWNDGWYGGDFTNGKIYKLDWNIQHEDGAIMEKRRIGGVAHDNQNRVVMDGFQVVVDTGIPQKKIATSISGDLPNGHFGESVSYHYQVIVNSRPAPVVISAGALPDGVEMDEDGNFTGIFNSVGTYSWTAKVTDGDGQSAQLNDSATVTLYLSGIWALLGTGNNMTMDFSASPVSWPISRPLSTNFNVKQTSPAWDGTTMCLPTSSPANSVVCIKAQDAGASGSIASTVASVGKNYDRVYGFPGLLIVGHNASGSYAYSTDHGATWTSVSSPSSLDLSGIARLDSGRWIAFFQSGATQQLYYSEDDIPINWNLALGSITGTGAQDIACDGKTGLFTNNIGTVWTTSDGSAWTSHAGVSPFQSTVVVLKGIGNGVFIGAGSDSNKNIAVSSDSGLTWKTIDFGDETNIIRSINRNGNTVVAQTPGHQYISYDLGQTWSRSPAAPLSSAVIAWLGDP